MIQSYLTVQRGNRRFCVALFRLFPSMPSLCTRFALQNLETMGCADCAIACTAKVSQCTMATVFLVVQKLESFGLRIANEHGGFSARWSFARRWRFSFQAQPRQLAPGRSYDFEPYVAGLWYTVPPRDWSDMSAGTLKLLVCKL